MRNNEVSTKRVVIWIYEIERYEVLDEAVDALTDGLLVLRYMFGLRGGALIAGAIDPLATRTTPDAIEAYLQTLMP
jgi:hypothetical protein